MEISVLMSIYKKENPVYLRDSLESIFNQTFSPSEIVIVEDGILTEELYSVIDGYVNKYSIVKRALFLYAFIKKFEKRE